VTRPNSVLDEISFFISTALLISTPLQWGDQGRSAGANRFNGLVIVLLRDSTSPNSETVETVQECTFPREPLDKSRG
jgi:hypothetical protein